MTQIRDAAQLVQFPPFKFSSTSTYHKAYNDKLYQNALNPKIVMKANYKANKLYQNQDLVEHIREYMPLTRKTISQFQNQMDKLERIFNDLIHSGFQIQDFMNKFFTVIDKRVRAFIDSIDFKSNQDEDIPFDFQFGVLRNHVREKLIKISNKLYEKFGAVPTPVEYDREILKRIETILRVYDLLRHDSSFSFVISRTQINLSHILAEVVENRCECTGLRDLLENCFVVSMRKFIDETSYALESNTPLFLSNKELVLEKFHSILKDRMENNLTPKDIIDIARSVIAKDRRVIHQEIYIQINKEIEKSAPQLLNQNTHFTQEKDKLYRAILKIRREWEELMRDDHYHLINQGQVNEDNLKYSVYRSSSELESLSSLSEFQNKVANLQYDAVTLLKEIIDFKGTSRIESTRQLDQVVQATIKDFKTMLPGKNPYANQIKQHIDSLFQDLDELLQRDPKKFVSDSSKLDENLKIELQKKKDNPYLQQVQKDQLRQSQTKELMQQQIQDNLKRKSDVIESQVKGLIDNHHQRQLEHQDLSTRPYTTSSEKQPTGKIMHGSSVDHQEPSRGFQDRYTRPEPHEVGKYTNQIIEDLGRPTQYNQPRDQRVGYLADQLLGPPPTRQDLISEIPSKYAQPTRQEAQQYNREVTPKVEPKRVEPPRPEPTKKVEPIKQEPPKKVEPPKQEPPKKVEPPKQEPPKKVEPPKPEPPKKVEPPKLEPPKKVEPPKPEPPKKVEPPKPEPPKKIEPPKPEPPKKVEPPKPEPPKKVEPPKPEPPKKVEPPKPEPPKKVEPPKPEPPKKVEPPKPEPPKKVEPPKPEPPKKVEPPKPEPPKKVEPVKPEPPKKVEPTKPESPKKVEPPKIEPPKKEEPKKPEPIVSPPIKKEEPKKPEPVEVKKEPVQPQKQQFQDPDDFLDEDIDDYEFDSYDAKAPSKPIVAPVVATPVQQQAVTKPVVKPVVDDIYDFGDEDIDLPDQQNQFGDDYDEDMGMGVNRQLEEESADDIEQLPINTLQNLHLVNDYIKKTKYSKQNALTFDEYNAYDYVFQIFEEFLQQGAGYFLDYSDAQKLIEINEKMIGGEDPNADIEEYMMGVMQAYQQMTQQEDFDPGMRLFMPFDLSFNKFMFVMVEKNPQTKFINIYFDEEPNEEVMNEEFENLIGVFQELFNCQDYEIGQIVLEENTANVLNSLGEEAIYIRYMLMVFSVLYETQSPLPDAKVGADTLERMFWCMHCCAPLYEKLESNPEGLQQHFDKMLTDFQKDKSLLIDSKTYELKEGFQKQILQDVDEIKKRFSKEKALKNGFLMIEIIHTQTKFVYYINMSKVASLQFLKVFFLSHFDEMNEQFMSLVLTPNDPTFSQKLYIDYARHNGLYEYNRMALAAWVHLTLKNNLKAEEAMSIINFTLAPFHILASGLE